MIIVRVQRSFMKIAKRMIQVEETNEKGIKIVTHSFE
jgi:hypothetical protein